MELLNHGPLGERKLQFMGRVVRLSLCQAPAGIGSDSIHTINMSLIEDSPKAKPACVGMEFKRSGEIGIGKNRCHHVQAL